MEKNRNSLQNLPFNYLSNPNDTKDGFINIVNCWVDETKMDIGEVSKEAGEYARVMLDIAVTDLKNKDIDALVTAPIHKKAMQLAGFQFPGHTEFLTYHSAQKIV